MMNLTIEDERLLAELCELQEISVDKIMKLIKTVR